ncbi:Uncharacterised protein [Providencia rustigianii]|uniref:hypothetical protein n=1 Tax=Providencia TaxID=586 RepID=UPI000D922E07|nr:MULTISPECIES: hypothetical protein [Providencia]MTC56131.1 hypothetical protein [Providencia rustigianii]SPY76286.1 Uncharacterised protein [Providencia rustigianii]VEB63328.1 Uncharacterised protein [Providencia rustigianii]
MAPITEEKQDGQALLVSSSRLNDNTSIMFYRIEKEKPEYEIEIYSDAYRSKTEDVIWLDYDAEYHCGDIHSTAFLQTDTAQEEVLLCDCYYSGDSIIFHAQLSNKQLSSIKAADKLQLKLSTPGVVINNGHEILLLTESMLSEWQQIIILGNDVD